MEERKIATRLTPKVKEFIREKFNTSDYENVNYDYYFHYPNFENFNGFLIGSHTGDDVEKGYTKATEQEFIDYFKVMNFEPSLITNLEMQRLEHFLNFIYDDAKFKENLLNNYIKSIKPPRKQITKAEAEKLLDAYIID